MLSIENAIISKGPNGTLSMVFDEIKKLNKCEKLLKVTCDNAGGQNKIMLHLILFIFSNLRLLQKCRIKLSGTWTY